MAYRPNVGRVLLYTVACISAQQNDAHISRRALPRATRPECMHVSIAYYFIRLQVMGLRSCDQVSDNHRSLSAICRFNCASEPHWANRRKLMETRCPFTITAEPVVERRMIHHNCPAGLLYSRPLSGPQHHTHDTPLDHSQLKLEMFQWFKWTTGIVYH